MRPFLRFIALPVLVVAGCSTSALAATETANASTLSTTLTIGATVQTAIRLTLGQGVSGTACAVTAASDYSMTFGNVDALGINNGTCGSKFAPTAAGSSPSAYYTDYKLTPVFTNQTATTATVTAYVSSNFGTLSSILGVVQALTAPSAIGDLGAMSLSSGSPTPVGSSLASGIAITRYIGVTVQPTNGATVSGAGTATVTYTMTAP